VFFKYYCCHPALKEFISGIYVLNIDFSLVANLSPIYTYVPTYTRFICFYLEDPVKVKKNDGEYVIRARSIIIGPQLTSVSLDLGKKHRSVIVGLTPCGMHRLLGIPLEEIVDRDYDATLILGPEVEEVLDRLMGAKTNDDQNEVIQNYLLNKLSQLRPALPFDKAMLQQVQARGLLSIDFLASQSCLSVRQFERKTLERIGFSPKLYARIIRFTNAYKYKELNPNATWSDIAYRFGYFDQMHFIRDFKCFAGFTPHFLTENDLVHSVRFQSIGN